MTTQTIPDGVDTAVRFCCDDIESGTINAADDGDSYIEAETGGVYAYALRLPWIIDGAAGPRATAIMTGYPSYGVNNAFGLGDCPSDHPYGVYRAEDGQFMGGCYVTADEAGAALQELGKLTAAPVPFPVFQYVTPDGSRSFSAAGVDAVGILDGVTANFTGWAHVEATCQIKIGLNPGPPPGSATRWDQSWAAVVVRVNGSDRLAPAFVSWPDVDPVNNPGYPYDVNDTATANVDGFVYVNDGDSIELVGWCDADDWLIIAKQGNEYVHNWQITRCDPPTMIVRVRLYDVDDNELHVVDRADVDGYEGEVTLAGLVNIPAGYRLRAWVELHAGTGQGVIVRESAHLAVTWESDEVTEDFCVDP